MVCFSCMTLLLDLMKILHLVCFLHICILLYDDSNAIVTITNSLFVGGMWIYSDNTSTIDIDSSTLSMLQDDVVNECQGHTTMEIYYQNSYVHVYIFYSL